MVEAGIDIGSHNGNMRLHVRPGGDAVRHILRADEAVAASNPATVGSLLFTAQPSGAKRKLRCAVASPASCVGA